LGLGSNDCRNPILRHAGVLLNGARRIRTADLLGAIQALCQLSYSPGLCGHGNLVPLPRTNKNNRIVFGSLLRDTSMSILDDAIREHLELKRQHGADESELKRLEDEVFGPPGRPDEDPFAEAPTEFMSTGATVAPESGAEEGSRRRINIADLQEPPPPESKVPAPEAPVETDAPELEITDASKPPHADAAPIAPAEDAAQAAPPAEEAPPALEHEVIAESPAEPSMPEPEGAAPEPAATPEPIEGGPSTEEREAIAEQPTQFFDIEAEMTSEEEPPADIASPSDEEIADAEAIEPKLAPAEPPTEIHASRVEPAEEPISEEHDYQDDFFSEQRLSDELDQALEAPLTDEQEVPPVSEAPRVSETEPPVTEHERHEDEEPEDDFEPEGEHEDVLEETPDFLEDAPEDDDLWFEQRPPKDFDFDD
jgi:hypothetical protein